MSAASGNVNYTAGSLTVEGSLAVQNTALFLNSFSIPLVPGSGTWGTPATKPGPPIDIYDAGSAFGGVLTIPQLGSVYSGSYALEVHSDVFDKATDFIMATLLTANTGILGYCYVSQESTIAGNFLLNVASPVTTVQVVNVMWTIVKRI